MSLRTKTVRVVTGGVVLYALLVTLGVLLWRSPVLLAGIFALASVVVLWLWRGSAARWMYVAAAILGPAGEYAAVRAGAWSYTDSAWLLPPWLPLAWGLTAAIFLRISQQLASTPSGSTGSR